jgi:hypothetical protein
MKNQDTKRKSDIDIKKSINTALLFAIIIGGFYLFDDLQRVGDDMQIKDLYETIEFKVDRQFDVSEKNLTWRVRGEDGYKDLNLKGKSFSWIASFGDIESVREAFDYYEFESDDLNTDNSIYNVKSAYYKNGVACLFGIIRRFNFEGNSQSVTEGEFNTTMTCASIHTDVIEVDN